MTYVTDGIGSAIEQAKVAAGEKEVHVQGAYTAHRALEAGVLDELQIHLVPELLGSGRRLFDVLPTEVELEIVRVVDTPEAPTSATASGAEEGNDMTDLDQWLALAHVLGGAVWTGAGVVICAFALDAVRHPELATVHRPYSVMRGLGPTVIGPSTLLVLGVGIALVARDDWVAMGDRRIVLGLALYLVVTLLGVLGLGRANRAAGAALDRGDLPHRRSRHAYLVTVRPRRDGPPPRRRDRRHGPSAMTRSLNDRLWR